MMVVVVALPKASSELGTQKAEPSNYQLQTGASTDLKGATNSPRRLTIKISVAEPGDLKVKEGEQVKTGQLIADRSDRKSTRLNSSHSSVSRMPSSA